MSDRMILSLLALLALAMVGFASIWPQGLGDRSPGPFGHFPVQRTPANQAALIKQNLDANRQIQEARAAAAAAKRNAAARVAPITVAPKLLAPPPPAPPAPKPAATGGLRPGQ